MLLNGAKLDIERHSKILLNSALQGRLEIVRLLIEYGFDVDTMEDEGETLIYKAIKGKCYGVCKYLHEKGANLKVQNRYNISLSDLIQNCDHKLIISYFAKAKQLSKYRSKHLDSKLHHSISSGKISENVKEENQEKSTVIITSNKSDLQRNGYIKKYQKNAYCI